MPLRRRGGASVAVTTAGAVLLALLSISRVAGHPACLDDSFQPLYGGASLRFCSSAWTGVDRADGVCCDGTRDDVAQAAYKWLVNSAANPGLTGNCSDAVKRIVCANCHPFSAHLYNEPVYAQGWPMNPMFCFNSNPGRKWLSDCVGELSPSSRILQNVQPSNLSIDNYCYPYPVAKYWATPNYTELGLIPMTEAWTFNPPLPFAVVGGYPVPGTNKLWGVSQAGQLFEWDGALTAGVDTTWTTVLTINTPDVDPNLLVPGPLQYKGSGSEGFLGIAFHPEWATNAAKRQFWMYYSIVTNSSSGRGSRISRFDYSAATPGSPASLLSTEFVVLEFNQPFTSHKGGRMFFSAGQRLAADYEPLLYVTSGDGGSEDDPQNNAQNEDALLGKVLRLDVLSDYSATGFGLAPTDAVNYGTSGNASLVYAKGLRSPASFSVDSVGGDMWVGIVGQGAREALYRVTPRANLLWPVLEGTRCNVDHTGTTQASCDALVTSAGATMPAMEYCHDNTAPGCPLTKYCATITSGCADSFQGNSVIIGTRYNGSKFPRLVGHFIYVDYKTTAVYMAHMSASPQGTPQVDYALRISAVGKSTTVIIEDKNKELFFVTHSYSSASKIYGLSCGVEWCCTYDNVTYPGTSLCDDAPGYNTPTPTLAPTAAPTKATTMAPSLAPTAAPTFTTTTAAPTLSPTLAPTVAPTMAPAATTATPTASPTKRTRLPTRSPTSITSTPTSTPTGTSTSLPTLAPSAAPSLGPTPLPTGSLTLAPSPPPTAAPTKRTRLPTRTPTSTSTPQPSQAPTPEPTRAPTTEPTRAPTLEPTRAPTMFPTRRATRSPDFTPAPTPTKRPTKAPKFTKAPTPTPNS